MSDDQQMTARRRRWLPGLIIAGIGPVGIAAAVAFTPDQTFRMIGIYYTSAAWLIAVLAWWLLASAVPRWLRLSLPIIVTAAAAIGWSMFVHRLEFDGAMVPRIVWTWQTSSDSEREQWFDRNASEGVDDPALEEPFQIVEEDWPRYCSADGSRIIPEPLTIRDWQQHPPQELWRHPVGEAWSSFAVVGPRLFTQEQRDSDECIVCYHTDSGRELWAHRDKTRYATAMGGTGPRATPTVTDKALFAVGATGLLTCLDPVTGFKRWQRDLTIDAGTEMPQWGFSGSPLIRNETVIVIAGGATGRAVLAYQRDTGDIVWGSGSHHPGYSSPRLEQINGRPVLLIFHGDGLSALDPDDGRQLWEYPMTNMYQVNVAQPILVNDRLFIGTGYDGKCVALDPLNIINGQPTEVWRPNRNLNLKFNEAVTHGGSVYGLDDGILCCLDPATGKRRWKGGRYNFGQVLLWDDMLLVQSERGDIALVTATPDAFQEVTRFTALKRHGSSDVRAWNVPVVNRSRLFVRSDREAACFAIPQQPAGESAGQ